MRRQIRVRGFTSVECDQASDEYYNSRSLRSRLGAWASLQSKPLDSRETLLNQVEKFSESLGQEPTRPKFWGGFRIVPAEIEFWAEGDLVYMIAFYGPKVLWMGLGTYNGYTLN